MKASIKRWRKVAKKLAAEEGVKSIRFYPIEKHYMVCGNDLFTGYFSPTTRTIVFCTLPYWRRTALHNLVHEISHAIDAQQRKRIPLKKQHDATFQKIWSRLRRKYLWNNK